MPMNGYGGCGLACRRRYATPVWNSLIFRGVPRMELQDEGHSAMNRSLRCRWTVAVILWITVTGTSAVVAVGGGYLVADGPPPLRFMSRPKLASVRIALPPLALSTPDSASSTNGSGGDPTRIDPTLDEVEPTNVVSESLNPPVDTRLIPPAATPPPSLFPGMTVTPQVLLSYFGSPGTNAINPVVMAPVSFIPAQPGAAPSSRATYRTVP